jgi:hypothetical protein
MIASQILEQTVEAFNKRRFAEAVMLAERGCQIAKGRDELFWFGLAEICQGYALLMASKLAPAESKLIAAMGKLRNFGYRHEDFEITSALAGIRQGVEEVRAVRQRRKKTFDLTLLPTLRMVAKADD